MEYDGAVQRLALQTLSRFSTAEVTQGIAQIGQDGMGFLSMVQTDPDLQSLRHDARLQDVFAAMRRKLPA